MRTLHSLHTVDVTPGQIGVTARNGDKWADALDQKIELCECLVKDNTGIPQHTVVGHAIVVEIWNGMFKDIPARFIEHEHELSSRMYSGLLASMRRAYGESFSESNHVTIVVYKRYD